MPTVWSRPRRPGSHQLVIRAMATRVPSPQVLGMKEPPVVSGDPGPSRGAPQIPTVSVGLVVYNGERYLAATIDSLLDQTFCDFEESAIVGTTRT
jgi:hypothetical protein